MKVTFNVSPTYKRLYNTDKPIIDLVGGRGRGGSFTGTDYFLECMLTLPYFRGCFLRYTLNDVRDSLFQDFKDRIEEKGLEQLFNIQEQQMRISCTINENQIISKGIIGGSVRTAKLKSLAGFTHVLIEEADEMDKQSFNQLIISLRTKKAEKIQVIRIFNPPPKSHWIWEDYNLTDSEVKGFYTYSPKTASGIEMLFGTYKDNLANLSHTAVARMLSYKDSDKEYYNVTVCGLISDGNAGRVYKSWKPITDAEFDAISCRPVYVVDFGYSSDPCAVIQVKWKDNKLYVNELVYEVGIDDLTLGKQLLDNGIAFRDVIIADYGNGGDVRIHNLRSAGSGVWKNIAGYKELEKGFNVQYAKKGAGSVNAGIDLVKQHEVFMTESSANGWNEVQEYAWAKGKFGEPIDYPVDKNNHIMDCVRYFATYRSTKGL